MAISIIGAITMTNLNKEELQIVEITNIVNTEVVNTTKEIAIEETITEQTPKKEETYTTMYSTTGLNIRFGPSTDDKILKAVVINTELETVQEVAEVAEVSTTNNLVKIGVGIGITAALVGLGYIVVKKIKAKKNAMVDTVEYSEVNSVEEETEE